MTMGGMTLFGLAQRAMSSQLVRMNAAASNLANAGSVATNEADAYRPLRPVFQQVAELDAVGKPGQPAFGRYGQGTQDAAAIELVRVAGAGTRPPTQMDRMVAAADAAVLAVIEDNRRKSLTPGRALGARPRTATGVELSPSKRMGTSLSAFDPVGIRPISTGPGYKDRRSEVFPAAGTLRRYEIGNPDPPPLGTLPARGAAVTSSPDGAAALNKSFIFDEQGFDENPWNTPSLNLIGKIGRASCRERVSSPV